MSSRAAFWKQGAPFFVMVIAAPYGLQYFNSLRYEFRKTTSVSQEDSIKYQEVDQAEKSGALVDDYLQKEIGKAQKQAKEEYVNIRGPRPWEDSKEVQRQQREALSKS